MPKSDICPLSKAASISVTTLRTAVSVEKTADKRIELRAAIHCHLDRGATEHEQPAQAT